MSARVVEAAPAREPLRRLRFFMAAAFCVLGGQAALLAITAPIGPAPAAAAVVSAPLRPALLDRNGEILAATLPAYTLVAAPNDVLDAKAAARKLNSVLPGLDAAATARRLADRSRSEVVLARGLTARQRHEIFQLALPGVNFRDQHERFYPQGPIAAHLIGSVNAELAGASGLERGLDTELKRPANREGLRLSLDLRIQHALEQELGRAAAAAAAKGGAGVVLDARTGETLALASWPEMNANAANNAAESVRLNRAVATYEMGSTMKPFIYAAALDAGDLNPSQAVDASPLSVGGLTLKDPHPLPAPVAPAQALAHSSNMVPARLALKLGVAGQEKLFHSLGLDSRPFGDLAEGDAGRISSRIDPLSVAVRGYGHGLTASVVGMAGAYTVFANHGTYVQPTLRYMPEPVKRAVFKPESAEAVLAMMRAAVSEGTARKAAVNGIQVAAKTGTAEKSGANGYDRDLNFSSIAAVFPADAPRYVLVLALDEPARTAETGGQATGGAVAAPAAGRLIGRIAPLLGLTAAPALEEKVP
jgi:cell division protein FtsI (penicillin-binding protein 3)